jgi:hypothetical protein
MVALSGYRNTKEVKKELGDCCFFVRIECRGVIDSVYGCESYVDDVPGVAMSAELSTYVPERTANQPRLPAANSIRSYVHAQYSR